MVRNIVSGYTLFEGSKKEVESRLRGDCSRGDTDLTGGSMVYFVRGEDVESHID